MWPPDLVTVVWSLFDGVGVVPSAADAEKYAVQCADSLEVADAQRVAKKRHKVAEKDNHHPSRKARAAACETRTPISADISADVSMISDDEDLDKLSNEPFSGCTSAITRHPLRGQSGQRQRCSREASDESEEGGHFSCESASGHPSRSPPRGALAVAGRRMAACPCQPWTQGSRQPCSQWRG